MTPSDPPPNPPTIEAIGEELRNQREARHVSLEQAAWSTHIRVRYLQALEAGDLAAMPSLAQARGFLRAYAGYLGMDPQPLLAVLPGEIPTQPLSPNPAAGWHSGEKPPEPPRPPSGQAEAIFAEVGQKLRQQRELLGISLEDVERHTHLRVHNLQALEAGNLTSLPSPVQGRGMLSNYAIFLGLDAEPLLLRFAEGLQAQLAARQAAAQPAARAARSPAKKPAPKTSSIRRLLAPDILTGGLVVVFLVSFVTWGALRITALRTQSASNTPTPTSPSIAEVLLTTPSPTPIQAIPASPLPLPATAALLVNTPFSFPLTIEVLTGTVPSGSATAAQTSQPSAATANLGALQLYIIVRQQAWMRVTVDGTIEFEGRVVAGSAYPFSADRRLEILTGNGAALQVFFNQIDLGAMGSLGEVVDRLYTLEGIQTPTITVTFTLRPTPKTTPTPTPKPATATKTP